MLCTAYTASYDTTEQNNTEKDAASVINGRGIVFVLEKIKFFAG